MVHSSRLWTHLWSDFYNAIETVHGKEEVNIHMEANWTQEGVCARRAAIWPNRDPIEYAGGINLYAYVGNNGINNVDPMGLSFWSATGSFVKSAVFSLAYTAAVGVLVTAAGAAATVVTPVLAIAAAVTAVAATAYGAFKLGEGLYTLATGQEYSFDGEGRLLTEDEYENEAAGLAGSLVGGGAAAKGYCRGPEFTIFGKNSSGQVQRVAPFGNRTGNPYGEFPHYHRGVPDPASPGNSMRGQGVGQHRPYEGGF